MLPARNRDTRTTSCTKRQHASNPAGGKISICCKKGANMTAAEPGQSNLNNHFSSSRSIICSGESGQAGGGDAGGEGGVGGGGSGGGPGGSGTARVLQPAAEAELQRPSEILPPAPGTRHMGALSGAQNWATILPFSTLK